jgi:hypothetical protein
VENFPPGFAEWLSPVRPQPFEYETVVVFGTAFGTLVALFFFLTDSMLRMKQTSVRRNEA